MSRSSKSMRVGPRCGGAPPAEAVAGAAGMEVEGAIGAKAAFADDAEEGLDALDAVGLVLLLLLLFAALDFDEDFFAEDLAAVCLEVAASAPLDSPTGPASVEISATARSAVRTRMGRRRVNRTLWRAVNACTAAIPLTNFVNPTSASRSAQPRTSRNPVAVSA